MALQPTSSFLFDHGFHAMQPKEVKQRVRALLDSDVDSDGRPVLKGLYQKIEVENEVNYRFNDVFEEKAKKIVVGFGAIEKMKVVFKAFVGLFRRDERYLWLANKERIEALFTSEVFASKDIKAAHTQGYKIRLFVRLPTEIEDKQQLAIELCSETFISNKLLLAPRIMSIYTRTSAFHYSFLRFFNQLSGFTNPLLDRFLLLNGINSYHQALVGIYKKIYVTGEGIERVNEPRSLFLRYCTSLSKALQINSEDMNRAQDSSIATSLDFIMGVEGAHHYRLWGNLVTSKLLLLCHAAIKQAALADHEGKLIEGKSETQLIPFKNEEALSIVKNMVANSIALSVDPSKKSALMEEIKPAVVRLKQQDAIEQDAIKGSVTVTEGLCALDDKLSPLMQFMPDFRKFIENGKNFAPGFKLAHDFELLK